MESFWSSKSAMTASLSWIDRISNNLVNQDQAGYAVSQASFADTFTQALSGQATAPNVSGRTTPPGLWAGTGIMTTNVDYNFSDMPLQPTGNPMDIGIQGNGFFVLKDPNGNLQLTKAGNLKWQPLKNGQYELTTGSGAAILGVNGKPIVQNGTHGDILVSSQGEVSYVDSSGLRKVLGQIAVVEVPLPGQTLTPVTGSTYALKPGITPYVVNRTPGQTTDTILQGSLNMPNVDLVVQMSDLIAAQRMFELNANALQMTDKMWQTADTIRNG